MYIKVGQKLVDLKTTLESDYKKDRETWVKNSNNTHNDNFVEKIQKKITEIDYDKVAENTRVKAKTLWSMTSGYLTKKTEGLFDN